MPRCSLTSFPLIILMPLIVMIAPLLCTASSTADEPLLRLRRLVPICLDGNYTANSTYQTNLMRLLSSLAAANVSPSGSVADTSGRVPDMVYGAVLCRGDIDAGACRRCLEYVANVVLRQCPHKKVAVVFYDYCMLRYADTWSFPSKLSAESAYLFLRNTTSVAAADLSLFREQVGTMMRRLIAYATSNSPSGRMFATGEAAFTPAEPKIYGLVQCTTDLSAKSCEECLTKFSSNEVPTWSQGTRGARKLGTTCWLWYELYHFYDGSAMVSVPSPLAAPAPAPRRAPALLPNLPQSDPSTSYKANTRQRGKHSSIIIVLVVVGAVLGLITTVICIGVWRTKASKKPHHAELSSSFVRFTRD